MAADTAARLGGAQQDLHPPSATRFSPEEEAVSCISLSAGKCNNTGDTICHDPIPESRAPCFWEIVSGANSKSHHFMHACRHTLLS